MLHKLIVQFNHNYVKDKVFIVIQQFVFIHQIQMETLIWYIIMDGVMQIHYEHGHFNIYQVKLLNLMKKIFRQLFYVIRKHG